MRNVNIKLLIAILLFSVGCISRKNSSKVKSAQYSGVMLEGNLGFDAQYGAYFTDLKFLDIDDNTYSNKNLSIQSSSNDNRFFIQSGRLTTVASRPLTKADLAKVGGVSFTPNALGEVSSEDEGLYFQISVNQLSTGQISTVDCWTSNKDSTLSFGYNGQIFVYCNGMPQASNPSTVDNTPASCAQDEELSASGECVCRPINDMFANETISKRSYGGKLTCTDYNNNLNYCLENGTRVDGSSCSCGGIFQNLSLFTANFAEECKYQNDFVSETETSAIQNTLSQAASATGSNTTSTNTSTLPWYLDPIYLKTANQSSQADLDYQNWLSDQANQSTASSQADLDYQNWLNDYGSIGNNTDGFDGGADY